MVVVLFIYACVVLVGGLTGYVKAGSYASLISGIVFGAILFTAAVALLRKKMWGGYVGLATAFTLDAFFTFRYLKALSFFPAGALALLSLIVFISLALWMRQRAIRG